MNKPLIIHMGSIILGILVGMKVLDYYSTHLTAQVAVTLAFGFGFGMIGKRLSRKIK